MYTFVACYRERKLTFVSFALSFSYILLTAAIWQPFEILIWSYFRTKLLENKTFVLCQILLICFNLRFTVSFVYCKIAFYIYSSAYMFCYFNNTVVVELIKL